MEFVLTPRSSMNAAKRCAEKHLYWPRVGEKIWQHSREPGLVFSPSMSAWRRPDENSRQESTRQPWYLPMSLADGKSRSEPGHGYQLSKIFPRLSAAPKLT